MQGSYKCIASVSVWCTAVALTPRRFFMCLCIFHHIVVRRNKVVMRKMPRPSVHQVEVFKVLVKGRHGYLFLIIVCCARV